MWGGELSSLTKPSSSNYWKPNAGQGQGDGSTVIVSMITLSPVTEEVPNATEMALGWALVKTEMQEFDFAAVRGRDQRC